MEVRFGFVNVIFVGKNVKKTTSQLNAKQIHSCGCKKIEFHNEKVKKYNNYSINDDVVTVKFENTDEYFICNLDDWELAKEYCWTLHHTGYAYTTINSKYIAFHNFMIKDKNDGKQIDHINLNRLDNQRKNLRIATKSQNMINRNIFSNNTSGHTGVSYNKKDNKWISRIQINNKRIVLGSFDNIEDAIRIRENAENEYFGEYKRKRVG